MDTLLTNYSITTSSGLVIQNTRPEHSEQLEELQRIVFPTLAEDEIILKK